MFQGIHSKKQGQGEIFSAPLRLVSAGSSLSEDTHYLDDDLYEERIATKKIDIPALANSLQTVYKTKN